MPTKVSRPSPQRKRKQPPSRTKFDVWLEEHCTSGETVDFVFKNSPFGGLSGICNFTALIFTVDRYHVYVELQHEDKGPMWIAKDNIISAS